MFVPYLFGKKQGDASQKYRHRQKCVVMLPVSMPERINADAQRKADHEIFECLIVYQVHSKYRQRAHDHWQYRTMNGTCKRGPDPHRIPIDPHRAKVTKCNKVAKIWCFGRFADFSSHPLHNFAS
jgi:hypothetical protein